ncbi:MAG: 2Fe-2S iron-sulfur cluster-binding protein [Hellea sp.]|nr:2Fe-2S iron-sulfur cluster-binding protein [Hellea sp.]
MILVNYDKILKFQFNGKHYEGYEGDTLASALLRENVKVVGRSFKYHRPRGIFGSGSEEPNALVKLEGSNTHEPNRRATSIKLYDGLKANSQNYIGNVKFDILALNDYIHPFISAGFYYKTFMWPKSFWEKVYEPIIRRAAGLGTLSTEPDPDRYDKGYLHCELLIIGSGPAGLKMALDASRNGKKVILVDEDFIMGGQLLSNEIDINGSSSLQWVEQTLSELRNSSNVRIMTRTSVYGVYDHGIYGALETVTDEIERPGARQILWRIYANKSVLASGATERPIAFPNNDRPGVMLASAVQTYNKRFDVKCGDNISLFTNNSGANLSKISNLIDTRDGSHIVNVHGRNLIRSITLNSGKKINSDCLAVSGGWNPNLQLTCHKRGRPKWNEKLSCFVPDNSNLPNNMYVIGSANGSFSTQSVFNDVSDLSEQLGYRITEKIKTEDNPLNLKPFWFVKSKKRSWVDFQNDVTVKDITLAHQEGFSSVEHVKRYTTLGMATDQGKTSNVIGLAVLADATNKTIPETGTTIFRPPYTPISIGAFAGAHKGKHFKPIRLTPSHEFASENGATFVDTGYWKRAQWFSQDKEVTWRDSVDREVLMTRNSVGICDVSTLGKIDIQGKDAGKFLNKIYINTFSTLKVGKCRYGLMLREDGIAMDDGTSARLSETHYIMTTTTAKAGSVYSHLEFCRQVLFPNMDVHIISTTDQWAQFSIAGPNARNLLSKIIDPSFNISNETFPYMACAEITICSGVRARIFRLSFSGELAYEISVPSRYGDALIRKLISAGKEFNVTMYGTEALGVMRIEKGHAAGNELDGRNTPVNLGLSGLMAKKKDYIGKTLSSREKLSGNETMVGFLSVNPSDKLTNGSHFVNIGDKILPENDQGHMSSVAYSPILERYIGIGFLKNGKDRYDETLKAIDFLQNNHVEVKVVSPHFIDPNGDRLRA